MNQRRGGEDFARDLATADQYVQVATIFEQARLDPRWISVISRPQFQPAAAKRPVDTGDPGDRRLLEQNKSIRGQLVADGRELDLQVGVDPIRCGADEGICQSAWRRAWAAAKQQPVQPMPGLPYRTLLAVV